jgi:hypothetical protein
MKYTFPFIVVVSLLLTSCGGRDQTPSKRVIGTWDCAYTNYYPNGKQTTATETEYFQNGTFATQSRIGMFITNDIASPITQTTTVGGNGVWHIENGFLCETVTNSRLSQAGSESKHQIIMLDGQTFSYREQNGDVHTATRRQ